MYIEYFGLEETPFSIAPDPRYLYMSERHREALAHLVYGIKSDGGFVLLTGEVGTGKTTVCRCFLEQIPQDCNVALVLNPKLTVLELLATVCDELGIDYPENNTSVKIFVDRINTFLLDAHAKGRKTVLIIDEAQNLDTEVLEQLRLLTNLETNQRKLLQIIMLGQPELRDMLSQPVLRQLAQRITARYHLGPLSQKEVAAYVNHRLSVAGLRSRLFPAPTISTLFRLSGGIPRRINILCDRALLGTYVQGQSSVHKSTLKKAAREVFGNADQGNGHWKMSKWWWLAGLALAGAGVTLGATCYHHESPLSAQSQPIRQGLSLQKLADQLDSDSEEMAYQALFGQWGIIYAPPEDTAVCQYAETKGLRCLKTRGNWRSLRHLNRPAVLTLFNNQGQEFYVTLTAIQEQAATLVVGSETRTVSVEEIESRWFGDYTLLWRPPPEFHGAIQPGDGGTEVQWLDRQLAAVQGQTPQPLQDFVFDDAMISQVKKFQLDEGLVPDGIVGTQTLIHLNTVVDGEVPLLINKQEDE
jgi:general secretion pathway protein A